MNLDFIKDYVKILKYIYKNLCYLKKNPIAQRTSLKLKITLKKS